MPRVNHLALFQLKPERTADEIELVRRPTADLPKAIQGIGVFNRSPDIGVESLSDRFTHSFSCTSERVAMWAGSRRFNFGVQGKS